MTQANLAKVVDFDFNKHLPQSAAEKTNDLFYILCTLYFAEKNQKELTRLTLQKTIYKTSQKLAEKNKLSFFTTYFYVNTLGPFNYMFYGYLEELESADLLEVEKKDIYLTPKGERVISQLFKEIDGEEGLQIILNELQKQTNNYANNPTKAISDTHSQRVVDSTDKNKVKTIETLIQETSPQKQFSSPTQFKYIEPPNFQETKKYTIPPSVINKLENATANIDSQIDYELFDNKSTGFLPT